MSRDAGGNPAVAKIGLIDSDSAMLGRMLLSSWSRSWKQKKQGKRDPCPNGED